MTSPAAGSGLSLTKLWLLLVGAGLLYQVGAEGWLRERLARHGRLTQATVVGLTEATGEDGPGYYLRLRFTTGTGGGGGATVWTSSQYTYDSLAYRVGQPVALRYDPRDPPVCLTETERTSRHFLVNALFTVPLIFYFWWLLFLRDS